MKDESVISLSENRRRVLDSLKKNKSLSFERLTHGLSYSSRLLCLHALEQLLEDGTIVEERPKLSRRVRRYRLAKKLVGGAD